MLQIFKYLIKFIKDRRAAVEYIESSVVYPIIIILISILISLSLLLINKSISVELEYHKSREILNNVGNEFQFIKHIDDKYLNEQKNLLNLKLNNLGYDNVELVKQEGLFFNKIDVIKKDSLRIRENKKVYFSDFTRKIDFMNFLITDIGLDEIINKDIESLFNR